MLVLGGGCLHRIYISRPSALVSGRETGEQRKGIGSGLQGIHKFGYAVCVGADTLTGLRVAFTHGLMFQADDGKCIVQGHHLVELDV